MNNNNFLKSNLINKKKSIYNTTGCPSKGKNVEDYKNPKSCKDKKVKLLFSVDKNQGCIDDATNKIQILNEYCDGIKDNNLLQKNNNTKVNSNLSPMERYKKNITPISKLNIPNNAPQSTLNTKNNTLNTKNNTNTLNTKNNTLNTKNNTLNTKNTKTAFFPTNITKLEYKLPDKFKKIGNMNTSNTAKAGVAIGSVIVLILVFLSLILLT